MLVLLNNIKYTIIYQSIYFEVILKYFIFWLFVQITKQFPRFFL